MPRRPGEIVKSLRRAESEGAGTVLRVGIYDAYLHTLGGGENLVAVLAQCLEHEFPMASVDLITHEHGPLTIKPLVERFGVHLERTQIRRLEARRRKHLRRSHTLRRILHEQDIARISREYDLFVNGTIFSLVPARSRRSLYLCMFPLNPIPASFASLSRLRRFIKAPYLFARSRALRRFIGQYDRILSISEFTRTWVETFWQMESHVLYPPVDTVSLLHLERKKKRILAIGRFFPGDHNKKHDILIETFASLSAHGLEDGWELHLAGGRTDVAGTDEYLHKLRRLARGLPIHIHVDVEPGFLKRLLTTSSIFWHATGYGEDERLDPYRLEHFGISTVEAMSHGCVPLVYAAGGQPEVVEDGVSGFLWRELSMLVDRTLMLAQDHQKRERLAQAAHLRSQCFNRAAFASAVHDIVADLFPRTIPLPTVMQERSSLSVDEPISR